MATLWELACSRALAGSGAAYNPVSISADLTRRYEHWEKGSYENFSSCSGWQVFVRQSVRSMGVFKG
jgi:hypothetical protein